MQIFETSQLEPRVSEGMIACMIESARKRAEPEEQVRIPPSGPPAEVITGPSLDLLVVDTYRYRSRQADRRITPPSLHLLVVDIAKETATATGAFDSSQVDKMQSICGRLTAAVPGIEHDSRVCGGEARIAHTRIPVWMLEQARRLGSTEQELLDAYPTLNPQDLTNAWAYAGSHREEIERDILENEEA